MPQVEIRRANRQLEQHNAAKTQRSTHPPYSPCSPTAGVEPTALAMLPTIEAENRALIALAQRKWRPPESILQKLADTALVLCRADSAGTQSPGR